MLSDRGLAVFLFSLLFSLLLIVTPVFAIILFIALIPSLFIIKARKTVIPLLLISGLIGASLAIRTIQRHQLTKRIGSPVTATGILHDIREEDHYTAGTLLFATLKTYRGQGLSLPGTMHFTVSGHLPKPLPEPGTAISLTGKLRKHRVYRNSGTDRSWFYISRHRLFSVSVPNPHMLSITPTFLSETLKKLNPFAKLRISPLNRRILRGIIAGDRNALPDAFVNKVRNLGIYHLFVVSGFHFGILFSAAYLLLLLIPVRPRTRQWIALSLVTLMLPVTGFSPSGLRAWLMIFLFLLFRAKEINISPADAVGLAGILLLIWNPYQVADPGFLLSFLVTAAIISAITPRDRWWQAWIKIPIIAFIAAAPILFIFFHRMSPMSIPVNICITPLIIVIFYLFFLTALGLPLASLLNRAVSLLTTLTDRVTPYTLPLWAPDFIIILLLAALTVALLLKNRRKGFGILVLALLPALALSLLWRPKPESLRIPDTGQSQAILLQTHGKTYLFDTAGLWEGRLALIPWLQTIGIRKVDAIFLSHFDSDHAGGLADIADTFPVGQVFAPYLDGHAFTFNRDFTALARHNIPLHLLSQTQTPRFSLPGIQITVLHPETAIRGTGPTNSRSLVVKIKVNNTTILFPGDLDGKELEKLIPRLPRADILLAPHHGSRHAAIPGLKNATSPRLVIVCCGRHNRFHFPSAAFRQLFTGTPIITTAAHGEITLPIPLPPLLRQQ